MRIRLISSFLLGIMVLAAGLKTPARAQMLKGDPAEEFGVRIGRVKYGGGGNWYNDPSSIPNLAAELQRRVGIPTNKDEKVVSLTDENLRAFPFIYITGNGTIRLTPEERDNLRAYLEDGGFLFINDSYGMDGAVRAMVKDVFPDHPLEELSNDHPVFHCFYEIDHYPQVPGLGSFLQGRTWEKGGFVSHLRAIQDDRGRAMVLINWNTDMGDGMEWSNATEYPGYAPHTADAYRMMINEIIYSLTH